MKRIIFLLFLFVIISPISVTGEFYKYIDENSNVLFTDDISKVPEAQRSKIEKHNERSIAPNESAYPSESETSSDAQEYSNNLEELFKEQYGAKETCPDETETEIQQAIETTWSQFNQAMIAGDVDKALTYIAIFHQVESKQKIEAFIAALGKEKFKDIHKTFKKVEICTFYKDEGIAECELISEEETGTYSYPMRFIRDIDCVWKIYEY